MEYDSEREHEEVLFKPIKPHFFKIILDDAIHSEKLVIPKRFVRKYGNELSDTVVLKIPSGANWQVDLTKNDDEAWLSKGWHKFAKSNHVKCGHFLVFEYEMNSCFSVVIFDTSATEIDYPCNTVNVANKANLDGKCRVRTMEETENERPHKRKRATLACQVESISQLHKSVSPNDMRRSCKISDRFRRLTFEEKEEALQRANAGFESENPFFMVVMNPTYLHASTLSVPFSFAKKYLQGSKGQVILQVKGGRSWVIRSNVLSHFKKASLSAGWNAFACDNNLQLGDVVIFELIANKKAVFNVIIFRATKDAKYGMPLGIKAGIGTTVVKANRNSSSKPESVHLYAESSKFISEDDNSRSCKKKLDRPLTLKGEKRKEALRRAKEGFKSENPYFMVVMQPKYIHGHHVRVPFLFVKKYLQQNHSRVILQCKGGQSWIIGLNVLSPAKKASFTLSWNVFVRNNNLKLGDVLIFELIEDRKPVFNVIISRATEGVKSSMPLGSNTRNRARVAKTSGSSSSKSKRLKKKASAKTQFTERSSCSSTPRHVEAANKFSSGNPSFTVVNSLRNFNKSSVRLPQKFTNKHVKRKSQTVELQVAGRLWAMRLNIYPSYGAVLCCGWGAFARDNDLRVGDVCVYGLTKKDPMVFDVLIIRHIG